MFASLLVIVLINSYFLILATVQADATVYAKKFISSHQLHLPPLKVLFYLIIIFYIKNKYFNSAFKLQLNKIVYNSYAVNSGSKGYQKQKKVLLNSFYCV